VTRVAVVDLGTNSTRLLVADIEGGRVDEVARSVTITRLGEGVDACRLLVPAAVARVEACLECYRLEAMELGAERWLAFATSAVRDAENGAEFLAALERKFDVTTLLLSGDEEALLTYRGVSAGSQLAGRTLVLDVGGGSTELIFGAGGELAFHTSLDIGCVRLTERFLRHDPPAPAETQALVAFVRTLLADRIPAEVRARRAIGVAGTVTTLATLDLGLAEENPALVHGHRLPRERIAAEAAKLAQTPLAELRCRRGLHPGRVQVIAGGALAVAEILAVFGLEELEVSEMDVLHGAELELAA
jgi:exopolyphosphatase / guanosine-5'-triphosphate,3'-diphosphate pyrophosphatase